MNGELVRYEEPVRRVSVQIETIGKYSVFCRRCKRRSTVTTEKWQDAENVHLAPSEVDRCDLCVAEILRKAWRS